MCREIKKFAQDHKLVSGRARFQNDLSLKLMLFHTFLIKDATEVFQ